MANPAPFGVAPPSVRELDYAQHFAAWFPPPRAMGLLPGMTMSQFMAQNFAPSGGMQRSHPPPLRHMPSDSGESDDSNDEDHQLSEWRARLRNLMAPMGLPQPDLMPSIHPHNARHMRAQAPQPGARNPFDSAQRQEASSQHQFKNKVVCELHCKSCNTDVCNRGMKAMLLADAHVELYSTDSPPPGVQLVGDDYMTRSCTCKIRDVACLGCGNVIGYHVTQPCEPCLDSCNNGHFWMYHSSEVAARNRKGSSGNLIVWANLVHPDKDKQLSSDSYERVCR